MSELMKATAAVRKFAKQYELIMICADALERIGSLEQAEQEGQRRLADVLAFVADGEKTIKEQEAAIEEKNNSLEMSVLETQAKVNILMHEAQSSAKELKEKAEDAAKKRIKEAHFSAEDMILKARAICVGLGNDADMIRKQVGELKAEKGTTEKELTEITQNIADARAAILRLAGM